MDRAKPNFYRVEGPGRYTTMTLATHEFIRRFLFHVLPKGFHRIRILRAAAAMLLICDPDRPTQIPAAWLMDA